MYTLKEVGELFKVSRRTVNRWIMNGKLNAIKIDKTVRVTEDELERFINNSNANANYRKTNKLYTPTEMAEMLKVTKKTILLWISGGKLNAIKIDKTVRVTEDELERFINSNNKYKGR